MGLGALITEGENGLIKVLSGKADQDDIDKLHDRKTNKEDTENMVDLIVE